MFFAHQSKVCWSCVILISIFDVLLAERQSSAQLRHPQIQLAVVIPFIENEFPSVIRVLHVWRNFGNLCSKGTAKEIDLVFYSNKAINTSTWHNLYFKEASSSLTNCFRNQHVLSADLLSEDNEYPAGPSNMFFDLFLKPRLQNFMVANYKTLFWYETDVFPIKTGWLDVLYQRSISGKFWICGSVYQGEHFDTAVLDELNVGWVGHINGNALYGLNDPEFFRFLELVKEAEPPNHFWKPFDVSIWKYLKHFPYTWNLYQKKIHCFVEDDYIRHYGSTISREEVFLAQQDSGVYLLHGSNVSAGIYEYLKKFKEGIPTKEVSDFEWTEAVPPSKKLSVMLRSWREDIDFAGIAVESVIAHLKYRLEIVVVVPEEDTAMFENAFMHLGVVVIGEPKYLDSGEIQQKYSKLMGDTYCKGAFILHLDSDIVLTRDVLLLDLFHNKKPIEFYESYTDLLAHKVISPWQKGTSLALGLLAVPEFSRRDLHVYPRGLYRAARAHIEKVHAMPLLDFLKTRRSVKTQQVAEIDIFSAFNYLGAYAYHFAPHVMHMVPLGVKERSLLNPGDVVLVPPFACKGHSKLAKLLPELKEYSINNLKNAVFDPALCTRMCSLFDLMFDCLQSVSWNAAGVVSGSDKQCLLRTLYTA